MFYVRLRVSTVTYGSDRGNLTAKAWLSLSLSFRTALIS